MKKRLVFEGIPMLLLVAACLAICTAYTGGPAAWTHPADAVAGTAGNASGNGTEEGRLELSGIGPISDIHVADNGMLYVFSGESENTVYALGPGGDLRWKFTVPGQWRVKNVFPYDEFDPGTWPPPPPSPDATPSSYPTGFSYLFEKAVYATDNGVLYLYIRENRTTFWNDRLNDDDPPQPESGDCNLEDRLLAISPEGKLLWNVSISPTHHVYEDAKIIPRDGRIYVLDGYNVTVLNDRGAELFKIRNVSGWPAIDEKGDIYAVPAAIIDPQPRGLTDYYEDAGIKGPSNAVEAYDADGRMLWHTDMDMMVIRPGFCSQPLYQNGTLWVAVENGVVALNMDGSVRWKKHYDTSQEPYRGESIGLFPTLPLDSHDNIYLFKNIPLDPFLNDNLFYIISSDGSETVRVDIPYCPSVDLDGIMYSSFDTNFGECLHGTISMGNVSLADVESDENVTAYDLTNGTVLWEYTVVPNFTETILTRDNAGRLLDPDISCDETDLISSGWMMPASALPGKNITYIIYQAVIYELPIVLGKSKCTYASEIYALDKHNGTLLWKKQLDTLVTSTTVNNSTLYYSTINGEVFTNQAGGIAGDIAGGIALAAVIYLIARFFCAGVFVRAKARLDKNGNRNAILASVTKNPGSTPSELAQRLRMNLGTVRYHLLVLRLSHRIVSHKAGGKFIRYYRNSGSYTRDDRLVISLVRRGNNGRVLRLLLDKPGLSNGELSRELNICESNVSRHIAELMANGIVVKKSRQDGLSAFFIRNECRERVAFAIGRAGGP